MVLEAWLFNFLRSSRLAGIASLRVVLRSGSIEEEYRRVYRGMVGIGLDFWISVSALANGEARGVGGHELCGQLSLRLAHC